MAGKSASYLTYVSTCHVSGVGCMFWWSQTLIRRTSVACHGDDVMMRAIVLNLSFKTGRTRTSVGDETNGGWIPALLTAVLFRVQQQYIYTMYTEYSYTTSILVAGVVFRKWQRFVGYLLCDETSRKFQIYHRNGEVLASEWGRASETQRATNPAHGQNSKNSKQQTANSSLRLRPSARISGPLGHYVHSIQLGPIQQPKHKCLAKSQPAAEDSSSSKSETFNLNPRPDRNPTYKVKRTHKNKTKIQGTHLVYHTSTAVRAKTHTPWRKIKQ